MNRSIAALAILALGLTAGCHAQIPPASAGSNVVLTATAPAASGNWAGCTTGAPCTYAFYAEVIAGTTCDATTSANYREITTLIARPSTPNFTDQNTTGLTKCYDVETVQASQNSGPSNIVGPVVSPGIPLAPALATPTPTTAELEKPALPFSPLRTWQNALRKPPAPSGLRALASK